jgi:uncharacterized protein (TIGR02217 family)
MSNLVFPSLPGLAWGMSKKPKWASRVQKSVSGKRQAIGYMSYPLYEWTLQFNVLREYASFSELETLQGFFNQMKGQVDTFLFADPVDAIILDGTSIGVGNGTDKLFQCARAYGGFIEPIFDPSILVVKVDGVTQTLTTHYTVNNGLIAFITAPANGAVITISGTFRYRCAFTQDTIDLINQDGVDIWKTNKITFESVKP